MNAALVAKENNDLPAMHRNLREAFLRIRDKRIEAKFSLRIHLAEALEEGGEFNEALEIYS